MDLMAHATKEWERFVQGESPGVNLKLFVGEIGVGKTHFLSVFLHDLLENYGNLCQKTILIRAELTERDRMSLLDLQRCVALALYRDLDERLGIAQKIRNIMLAGYTPGVHPPVPAFIEEIITWDANKVDQFIEVVGHICRPGSRIGAQLGPRAPSRLCFFLDNSDQLSMANVAELYSWCNNTSGNAKSLLWVFLRPETFRLLQVQHQRAPIGLRSPEPVYAPTLREAVEKRIATFPMQFKGTERVKLPFGPGEFTPEDVQKAVSYFASQALETADHMLTRLTESPDSDGQPDLRAGLQGLLGILGSHVMTDEEYAMAILGRVTRHAGETGGKRPRRATAGWPRVLEALILGRRVWFSSACGAVEHVFDPPNVETYGDYFLLVHILQCLDRRHEEITFADLCARLGRLGYAMGRVQEGLRHLATRQIILEEGRPDDDPFARRTFPLVMVDVPSENAPYRDSTTVRVTPWGSYHISTLVWQAQYWKHIFYDLVLPASLANRLDARCIHGPAPGLADQLQKVLTYLTEVEASWLHGLTRADLKSLGIAPIMEVTGKKVLKQIH